MAEVTIPDKNLTLTEPGEIKNHLASIGIDYERWDADELRVSSDASEEEILFEDRTVGRKRLPTNVFGLLFHIAEHTARHTGQVITLVRIVRK